MNSPPHALRGKKSPGQRDVGAEASRACEVFRRSELWSRIVGDTEAHAQNKSRYSRMMTECTPRRAFDNTRSEAAPPRFMQPAIPSSAYDMSSSLSSPTSASVVSVSTPTVRASPSNLELLISPSSEAKPRLRLLVFLFLMILKTQGSTRC